MKIFLFCHLWLECTFFEHLPNLLCIDCLINWAWLWCLVLLFLNCLITKCVGIWLFRNKYTRWTCIFWNNIRGFWAWFLLNIWVWRLWHKLFIRRRKRLWNIGNFTFLCISLICFRIDIIFWCYLKFSLIIYTFILYIIRWIFLRYYPLRLIFLFVRHKIRVCKHLFLFILIPDLSIIYSIIILNLIRSIILFWLLRRFIDWLFSNIWIWRFLHSCIFIINWLILFCCYLWRFHTFIILLIFICIL